jgi:nucleoside-diphosphate-sugar epimerase
MKLFVTGGTGFVGTHFVRAALAAGHDVVALRRPGSRPRLPLATEPRWIDGPLDADWTAHLQGCDALVHLASHTPNPPYASLDECLYWNVFAALKLATQAHAAGVGRYLVAGSCFEYGRAAEQVEFVDVDMPLQPTLSYPVSKAAATAAFDGFARLNGVRLKHMRLFQVYGEGEQASRFWPSLRKAAGEGADFPMSPGEQVRDFIEVSEAASQILSHLDFSRSEPGAPTVHHVATGRPRSLRDFAEAWWREWNATGRLLLGAMPYRAGELMRLVPAPPLEDDA